jgi:hypothetical protein
MKRVVETSYVRTQQQPQLRAPRNLSGTDTLPHSIFGVHTLLEFQYNHRHGNV